MSIYDSAKIAVDEDDVKIVDFDIREIISKSLTNIRVIDRKGRLSPSSGCSHCALQGTMTGIEAFTDSWDVTSEFYARMGIAIEDIIANGFEEALESIHVDTISRGLDDYLLKQDLRLYETPHSLKLGGASDLIMQDHHGRMVIGEVKSCGQLPSKPKPYQLSQLLLYMAYYNTSGSLIYQSRGVMNRRRELSLKQFDIPFDMGVARQVMTKTFMSRLCIDRGVLPLKLIEKRSACGFCAFQQQCWEDVPWVHESKYPTLTNSQYIEMLEEIEPMVDEWFGEENLLERRKDMYDKCLKPNPVQLVTQFLSAAKNWAEYKLGLTEDAPKIRNPLDVINHAGKVTESFDDFLLRFDH